MCADPFHIQVYLRITKTVFTNDPEFISSYIKHNPFAAFAKYVGTGKGLLDVCWGCPVSYPERIQP
jgi:hypothetical protein